jgi:hypothetical protein
MVKLAQIALLAALFGATVAAAQTGRMSPADNEASAMGNCFDRRLGVSRSAMDGPVGSSRPASNPDAGSSALSSPPPPSRDAGASDAAAAPGTAGNSASPSSLPDCQ